MPKKITLSNIQDCKKCSRLSHFLDDVKLKHPHYFCKPVPSFGCDTAQLLIVGLAPGLHGANATGRPFTGDFAGLLLYQTLFKYGFSSQADSSEINDGLDLINCQITNAVKCLPPQNKPNSSEVNTCNAFLKEELSRKTIKVVVALGGIAHKAIIKALALRQADYAFGHQNFHQLADFKLIDSYHCSKYNTQTKRLTETMFHDVFAQAQSIVLSNND